MNEDFLSRKMLSTATLTEQIAEHLHKFTNYADSHSIFRGELKFCTPPLLLFSASVDRGRMLLVKFLMTFSVVDVDWYKCDYLSQSYWPTFITGTKRDVPSRG